MFRGLTVCAVAGVFWVTVVFAFGLVERPVPSAPFFAAVVSTLVVVVGALANYRERDGFAVAFLGSLLIAGLISFYALEVMQPWLGGAAAGLTLKPYRWHLVSIGVMLAAVCVLVFISGAEPFKRELKPRPRRSPSAAYGNADWMALGKVRKHLSPHGDVPLGERYRPDRDRTAPDIFDPRDPGTWGFGGKGQLICDDISKGATHGLVFAGSGGYKTTGFVVPFLVKWPHNAVVLDPSGEIEPMMREYRTKIVDEERRVYRIDPRVPGSGMNVLDWVGSNGPLEQDVAQLVSWIANLKTAESRNDFFVSRAQQLLRGLLAHICLHPTFERRRQLRTLRELISNDEPKFRVVLKEICDSWEDARDYVRLELAAFESMTAETFSGIYATASDLTSWLSFDDMANIVSEGAFRTLDIAEQQIDVFLCIDLGILDVHPALANVLFGSLLNAQYQMAGKSGRRVGFVLDEAYRLGNMKLIETARDAGRKYLISLFLMYQSLGQLRDQWHSRNAVSKWMDSTEWQLFAVIGDQETAEWLSKKCGTFTQVVRSSSKNSSSRGSVGESASTSLVRRDLLLPHEVFEMRGDEQLLFVRGLPPIRCGRPIYFRREEMRKKVGANRFALDAGGAMGIATSLPLQVQLTEDGANGS